MTQAIFQHAPLIPHNLSVSRPSSTTPIASDIKDKARDLYIKGNKSQTAIAAQLGIHPKTLSYWIKQNSWHDIKCKFSLSPIFIRQNLYAQLEALSEHILTRVEENTFPSYQEVLAQYKLVSAIFKFPDYSYEDLQKIYKDLYSSDKILDKKTPAQKASSADNDSGKIAESQPLVTKPLDKDGIKKQVENDAGEQDAEDIGDVYIPRRNVVLRSGARWIEKGIVYDPALRQNRKLKRVEWDELMKKGLTKADFQGWQPAS